MGVNSFREKEQKYREYKYPIHDNFVMDRTKKKEKKAIYIRTDYFEDRNEILTDVFYDVGNGAKNPLLDIEEGNQIDKEVLEFAVLIAKNAKKYSTENINFFDSKKMEDLKISDENLDEACIVNTELTNDVGALELINAISKAASELLIPVYVGADRVTDIPLYNGLALYKNDSEFSSEFTNKEDFAEMVDGRQRVIESIEEMGMRQEEKAEEEQNLDNLSEDELENMLRLEQEQNQAKKEELDNIRKQELIAQIKAAQQEGKELDEQIAEANKNNRLRD